MDTLTHALTGALLGRATAPRHASAQTIPTGRRVLVGFFAAAFPDTDVALSLISPLAYLLHHRGVTHSILLLPVWSVLLAGLCSLAWRQGPGWRAYFGIIAIALGSHIAEDWITSFGTMVFAPFSDWRAALSTTFIIDLWFTGIILAALLAAIVWRRSRLPAVAGLVMLCTYVGMQYAARERAIEFGERYARGAGIERARVSAQPRPVSPFNWMVVVEDGERYRYSLVNLVRREPLPPAPDAGLIARLDAPYLPLGRADWSTVYRFGPRADEARIAEAAFNAAAFGFFRWFARYPVLSRVEHGNPRTCAWFEDLRFYTPGRDRVPFRYGMCAESGGPWRAYELDGGVRSPVH